jgi:hydrogenase maturation protease
MATRIIGLGQSTAGDDGLGFAVLGWIREMGVPAGAELFEAKEASALIALLETASQVVLVDAIVGHGTVGHVVEFRAEELDARRPGPRPVSTHGLDVGQAVALARLVSGDTRPSEIWVVGVTIEAPRQYGHGLSPAVRDAVPAAGRAVLARVRK